MKYFSETLNKAFDTEEECLKAEEAKKQELAEAAEKETAIANEKKAAAKEIEDADKAIDAAYEALEAAKVAARDVRDKYNEDIIKAREELDNKLASLRNESIEEQHKILDPAYDAYNDAQQARMNAIERFNEKFGTYKQVYTGSRAAKEYNRISRQIDNMFRNFWLF